VIESEEKPDNALVEEIIKRELSDKTLLGFKARLNLHRLLDAGKLNAIEAQCIEDKQFTSRRLIAGQSTSNHVVAVVQTAMDKLKQAEGDLADLEAQIA
jgi:hypothetical protein